VIVRDMLSLDFVWQTRFQADIAHDVSTERWLFAKAAIILAILVLLLFIRHRLS
jgi:hypothetical protein